MHVTFCVLSISSIVAVLPLCCGCGSEARKRADKENVPRLISRSQAQRQAASANIGVVRFALERYALAVESFPTTAQGLAALRSVPADLPDKTKWQGPYLAGPLRVDPWVNSYGYVSPGVHNPDSFDV